MKTVPDRLFKIIPEIAQIFAVKRLEIKGELTLPVVMNAGDLKGVPTLLEMQCLLATVASVALRPRRTRRTQAQKRTTRPAAYSCVSPLMTILRMYSLKNSRLQMSTSVGSFK